MFDGTCQNVIRSCNCYHELFRTKYNYFISQPSYSRRKLFDPPVIKSLTGLKVEKLKFYQIEGYNVEKKLQSCQSSCWSRDIIFVFSSVPHYITYIISCGDYLDDYDSDPPIFSQTLDGITCDLHPSVTV